MNPISKLFLCMLIAVPLSRPASALGGDGAQGSQAHDTEILEELYEFHAEAWAAMMEGRFEDALRAAGEMERGMPAGLLEGSPEVADGFLPAKYHALVRFGEWEQILDESKPDSDRRASRALWHYARTLALTNLRRIEAAHEELELLEREAEGLPQGWRIVSEDASDVLEIARWMAAGELAYHEGRISDAFEALEKAASLEDALRSGPAPAWMHPVRHALGALLLAEGRAEAAERVYREDLQQNPENGWSLLGLQQALAAQDRLDEAEQLTTAVAAAWEDADAMPIASCYCHPDANAARRHSHGVVEFDVSCSEVARAAIETGLAHLHHMMYEQARPYFEAAAEADPSCAMAHWGIAMTSFQPLWHPASEEGLERGKSAVERAMELDPPTEREQQYVAAAAAFFDDPSPPEASRADDHAARVGNWMRAQRALHEAYPEDVDAAAFYALAEVCYAMTQFSPKGERDFTRELRAGALLERLLEEHPEHPGLFHYLIHAYDSTELAPKAREVAESYDQLAPESPHALHMPSHIFVRLGDWEETAEWNERSADASLRLVEDDPHASAHYVHALDYMMYGYLQLGKEDKARETLDRVQQIQELWPASFAAYNAAASQARYFLELGLWEEAAKLEADVPEALAWEEFPVGEAIFRYARGLGAARSGDLEQAEAECKEITARADALHDAGDAYWAYMTEALAKSVEAWILYERGETDAAVTLMRQAAELEDSMDKHPTTPGEVLPVRELYAELLLDQGRPADAAEAFRASLDRTPNRSNALRGLEQALAKAAQE